MQVQLQPYQLPGHGFNIGNIIVNSNNNDIGKQANQISKFILILDTSGSMGYLVEKVLRSVQESLLKTPGFQNNTIITIITFDSNVKMYEISVAAMCNQYISASGCTYFKSVPAYLVDAIRRSNRDYNTNYFKILCISDGDIHDQEDAMKNIQNIKPVLTSNLLYNVCAIRLFSTRDGSPDTRTLVGISQLDNTGKQIKLNEILYGQSLTAISEFMNAQFSGSVTTLVSKESNIQEYPWTVPVNSISFTNDNAWLFFKNLPTSDSLLVNNQQVIILPPLLLTVSDFGNKLAQVFSKIDNTIKSLLITNTASSKQTLGEILKYLDTLQAWEIEQANLEAINNNDHADNSKVRIAYSLSFKRASIKQRITQQRRTVIRALQELINNDTVSKLNSNQKAEFLRSDVVSNAKSKRLARVAGVAGDDFNLDERVRIEVQNICNNIHLLKDINTDNSLVSFFSQESCLESLRQLVEVLPYLQDLDAADIFKLVNIVGIGCNATIGEYPDPRLWKPNELYPSCNISVSDIITYHTMKKTSSKDDNYDFTQGIPVPGHPGATMNCIVPIFSETDLPVLNFLYTYAPTILNISTSINIRRLSLDVPDSFYYVCAAGAFKLCQLIVKDNCTELHLTTLKNIVNALNQPTYTRGYRKLFLSNDVDPLLNMNAFTNTTNTIVPVAMLLTLTWEYCEANKETVAKLLRSIFNFETYHHIKGIIKKACADPTTYDKIRQKHINKMLNIDDRMPDVGAAFSDDPVFKKVSINLEEKLEEAMDKHSGRLTILKTLAILPTIITWDSDKIKTCLADPNLEFKSLDLDYDNLKLYVLHQTLLGLIYNSQSERINIDEARVLVPNFTDKKSATEYFTNYVNKVYENRFNNALSNKHTTELEEAANILADTIIQSTNKEEILDLFKNGITDSVRGNQVVTKFINQYSEGVDYLLTSLLDATLTVPLRVFKLKVLILGVDDNRERVWNGQNTIKGIKTTSLKPFFNDYEWDEYSTVFKVYKAHSYRSSDLPNRHGFCNSNPSFYGMGYETFEEFLELATNNEVTEYVNANKNKKYRALCCQ